MSPRKRRLWTAALFTFLIPPVAGGCAQVTIVSPKEEVTVERSLGLLVVKIPQGETTKVIDMTALGLAVSPTGLTLGYQDWSGAVAGAGDCRAIFWIEKAEQVERVRELLGDIDQVCVLPRISKGNGNDK